MDLAHLILILGFLMMDVVRFCIIFLQLDMLQCTLKNDYFRPNLSPLSPSSLYCTTFFVTTVRHSSSPNLPPLSPSSLYCTTFFVTLKEVRIMFSLFCCFIRIERHGRRQNYSIIKQIGLSIFKKLSVEQFFKL